MEKLKIDKTKLTLAGSMNYLVQIMSDEENKKMVYVDNYMPRKNLVSSQNHITKEEAKSLAIEQIERMKIAINLMQDFINDKTDTVYYWQLNDEKY